MIHLTITDARKKQNHDGQWWVMHPSNDAILAYCDTEEEADKVISSLNKAEKAANENYDYAIVWMGSKMFYICDDSFGPAKDQVQSKLDMLLNDPNDWCRNGHIRILTVHSEYKKGKKI